MNLTRRSSPSNSPAGSNIPGDFRYGPLKSSKTGIRLAQILPGTGNKGLAITLVDSFVTGPTKLPYDALSYTWGDASRSKSISCNGRRLAVTQTLLDALHRFRDATHTVTLWIDQICICQERVKERNQQVSIMGDIFKAAQKVIVWLGGDYDDSRAGMQLADQLRRIVGHPVHGTGLGPEHIDLYGLPRRGHKKWKALSAILRRPWFWRSWVVQEVVLNPQVELVLGANMLTWDELEMVVALLEGPLPEAWHMDQAISFSELPFSRINRIRLRHRELSNLRPSTATDVVLGAITGPELVADPESLLSSQHDNDPELLDLLLVSRELGASDPRDKVYALLGLGKHEITPDYASSPEDVFIEFAQHQIGAVTNLQATANIVQEELDVDRMEVRRAMVMFSCAGRVNQKRKLPSWVPDWTTSLASRPLIFGIGGGYRAGGNTLGPVDYDFDRGLQLTGVLLDTVRSVGETLLSLTSKEEPHEMISRWWREARTIALKRIAFSPGSTAYTDAFEAMRRRLLLCKHGYYTGESSTTRRDSLLDDTETGTNSAGHSATQTLTLGPTRGRVMMATATGFLGLAPHGTREGDVVFIIRGADIPYVLRHAQDDAYVLIGETYMQGIMDGEALGMSIQQTIVLR
ncbi:hypothetical protein LTR62_008319 [Meristemomyces frigidus]|uniref:Heterokaryon incompatibility domain-containing protein n=1 Tax=Meristemomyces frigidus TaxID=1508187 RepID=A0AAN7YH84_9PEZI|nr:hypothetical protein LTR62_008319 [Meristemomyces frigidus]